MFNVQLPERFTSKIEVDNNSGCWNWTACKDDHGYGRINTRSSGKYVYWKAHRYAWTMVNGEIPKGMIILHKCDNPPCVNPDHLRIGTYKDNSQDMVQKGRGKIVHYRGEKHSRARFTNEQVREMRRLYEHEGLSQSEIGRRYNAAPAVARRIVKYETWKDVE
jgi:hypothetical protein